MEIWILVDQTND